MAVKEVSAGAVVFRVVKGERKFLLLHYNYTQPFWDFPKGKLEKGETPLDAARREVREESGIDGIDIKDGFTHVIHYFYTREGKTVDKTVSFFVAETDKEKVTLSDEHIGYVWLPYAAALKRVTFKNGKETLEKAEAFLG